MVLITVDGNIGCGKTSVLNYLHRNHKIPVDLEPVENWTPYLLDLYDSSSNVFKFQIRVWLDRCWIQEKSHDINIFVERSPRFIKDVFIQIAEDTKMISPSEKQILLDLHTKTDHFWNNSIHIYLRSSAENCMKKIKKRNRSSEKHITDEYINDLHNRHETLYGKIMNEQNKQVYCIDVDNKSIADVANEIIEISNEINQTI